MMSYLKPATCLYSKSKEDSSHGNRVKAHMTAFIKTRLTTQATAAVHEAIEAANLPKDDKTPRDAVTSIVTDINTKQKNQTHTKSKKSKSATSKPTKAVKGHPAKAKHPTPQPHPKAKGTRKQAPADKPKKGNQTKPNKDPEDTPTKANKVNFKGILKNKGKHKGGASQHTNKNQKHRHGKPNTPKQKKDK